MNNFLLQKWIDFYTDGSEANESLEINTNSRNDLTSCGNAYIPDCTFQNISGSGNGGVISYISVSSSKLLVEHSSFNTCSITSLGGAIYFFNKGH